MFIFSRLMCEMTLTAHHLIAIGRGDFWPTMAGRRLPPTETVVLRLGRNRQGPDILLTLTGAYGRMAWAPTTQQSMGLEHDRGSRPD